MSNELKNLMKYINKRELTFTEIISLLECAKFNILMNMTRGSKLEKVED